MAITPPDAEELTVPSEDHRRKPQVEYIKTALEMDWLTDEEMSDILESFPLTKMRHLVYKYAGMDASLFMTLKQQVRLVNSVVNNLVTPAGEIRPSAADAEISLKDALMLSERVTRMMLKDLPEVYNLERVAKLEQAMGDVMEKNFTPEQQSLVLDRLQELTANGG